MFCCLFSFASCLGQAFSQTWQQFLICRLLLGFGIGPKSATIPIYAAESVPSEEIRGALVMSWQLWTAFGIMLGYTFTYAFGTVRLFILKSNVYLMASGVPMEVNDRQPGRFFDACNAFMLIRSAGCSCRSLFLDDVTPRVATLASPQSRPFGKTSIAREPLGD